MKKTVPGLARICYSFVSTIEKTALSSLTKETGADFPRATTEFRIVTELAPFPEYVTLRTFCDASEEGFVRCGVATIGKELLKLNFFSVKISK